MTDVVHVDNLQALAARLNLAWLFLAGEDRQFVQVHLRNDEMRFAEFTYFMPIKAYHDGKSGGLAVLIHRGDACQVASHMFAVEVDTLQDADLHDACGEVCNVFFDAVATHLSGADDVSIGLPLRVSAKQFEYAAANFVATAIYESVRGPNRLHVVVYYGLEPIR